MNILCPKLKTHSRTKVCKQSISSTSEYKRTSADVLLPDGMNLNQELVKQGWCWWYRKYAPENTALKELEAEAREGRKGLWADPQPVQLRKWRKRNR